MSKLKQLGEIAKGFSNLLKNKLNLSSEEEKELGNKRMDVCKECPFISALRVCTKCGCYLPAKTKVKSSECPEKYW